MGGSSQPVPLFGPREGHRQINNKTPMWGENGLIPLCFAVTIASFFLFPGQKTDKAVVLAKVIEPALLRNFGGHYLAMSLIVKHRFQYRGMEEIYCLMQSI